MHRTVILSLEGTKLIHLLFVNCVQTEFEILTTRLSQLGGTLPLGSNNLTIQFLCRWEERRGWFCLQTYDTAYNIT